MTVYKLSYLQQSTRKKSFRIDNRNRHLAAETYEFLNTILELNPNPVFYKNREGVYVYCNTAFSDFLGIAKNQIIGRTTFDVNPGELADIYHKQDIEILETKFRHSYKTKARLSDGIYHDILLNKTADIDSNNNFKGIVGNVTDITEVVSYEEKIRRLLRLNQTMLEINKIILEKNDIIEISNLVLEKVSIAMEKADIGCVLVLDKEDNLKIIASKGYDKEQCKKFSIKLQESFHYLKTQGKIDEPIIINDIQKFDWKRYADYWKRSRNSKNRTVLIDESEDVDWINYSKVLESAEEIKLQSSISTPLLFDGQLFGFINIDSTLNYAFDESDLEVMEYIKNQIEVGLSKFKLYEQMVYLSRYDKLTNIYNRAYFEELFSASLSEAGKNKDEFLLTIFDFNKLKSINDTYGHLGGDELIKRFSLCLTSILKEGDYLGRLGGDEFAAVIYNNRLEELKEKFEIINKELMENPVLFENCKIPGSFSYGISQFPRDGTEYNSLFKKADMNMYEYKQKLK